MRIAAILGLGSSTNQLHPFARISDAPWQVGLPARACDADAILIFGGDGTVHRHLAELVRLQLPVLVVPCGSGNDFARALNLRRAGDSVSAWQSFCGGDTNVRSIDLGLITPLGSEDPIPGFSREAGSMEALGRQGRYFCCVGGMGLDAEIARRANQLPRWMRRRGGYLLSLPPALLRFKAFPLKVISSPPDPSGALAVTYDERAMVVAFANAPAYGDGIRIAPHARLDDGKLDICIVGNMGKVRLLRSFPSAYSGSHLGIPEVKYFQTERLRLETEWPMDVYADGEYVCRTPVEVSVEKAALRVIVA
ncbi:MAG TPA: diacylglycerol kinase family protein [Terriglobales bacterium]|jgi:diacylglycerol kinase (ATP)|nr:diacylglycerol kinase family protein [Terriglobales bacterium]